MQTGTETCTRWDGGHRTSGEQRELNWSSPNSDETGSRRFWIIPVAKCDIAKMDTIDMFKFWGAVYSLWKRGDIKEYLEDDEMAKLNEINLICVHNKVIKY